MVLNANFAVRRIFLKHFNKIKRLNSFVSQWFTSPFRTITKL